VGFMFAWARLTVVQSGSVALFAYIFGDYASELVSLGDYSSALYAAFTVVVLTGLNLSGIRQTKTFQNTLFFATLCGLGVLILVGLFGVEARPAPSDVPASVSLAGVGTAMLFVLLAFGGWNEAAYI